MPTPDCDNQCQVTNSPSFETHLGAMAGVVAVMEDTVVVVNENVPKGLSFVYFGEKTAPVAGKWAKRDSRAVKSRGSELEVKNLSSLGGVWCLQR